jgi:hypothetical protein
VTLGDSKADFQGRTTVQLGLRATAPQSPKFTPAVKTALDTWSKSTDQAQALYTNIINSEASLEQSYTTLGTLLVQVGHDRDGFITAVQNECTSSADAKGFGAGAVEPGKHVEPVPPGVVRQVPTSLSGTAKVRWPSEPGAASYIAQQSTADPPTEASFVQCYLGMSPFFELTGGPAQKVWIRIASVGKAVSAWSTPFQVVLR